MNTDHRSTYPIVIDPKKILNPQHFITKMFLIVLIGLFWVPLATAKERTLDNLRNLGTDFAEIVEKVSPAVVFIKVEQEVKGQPMLNYGKQSPNNPFDLFNDEFMRRYFGQQFQQRQSPPQRVIGQGSGFIISKDGYILTNNHVAGKADKITVKLNDGREFDAKLVGADSHSDVAVIKIEADNLPTLPFGDSDNLRVGEWVLAFGNPFGLSHTVTAGIVSAKGRSGVGITDYEDFIQTDAAINPGNSGGPLINLNGQVVGINTAIFSKSGGYMGIGFTIPINMVKVIHDQLIAHGEVTRGYLGVNIQDLTPELAKSFGLKDKKGILVADVVKDSPADNSGIKRGDVILKMNNNDVVDAGKFRNQIALILPGHKIHLVLWRKNGQQSVSVDIGKRPESDPAKSADSERLSKLGIAVTNLIPSLAEQFGYQGESGVLITDVDRDSIAAWSGLRPGMLIQEVNQHPVKKVGEFLERLPQKGNVLLLIKAGPQTLFITFALD